MRRKSKICLMTGILAALAQTVSPAVASQTDAPATGSDSAPPAIVVWTYNYARVPEPVLREAQAEATRIFATTRTRVSWVRCPASAAEVRANPVCQERMSAREIALTIFAKPEELSLSTGSSKSARDNAYFGFARVYGNGQFGHLAYVFYDQISDPANRGQASESQTLAVVAAHELGHLLLGSAAHSSSGLMRDHWDRDDLKRAAWGWLQFATPEAARIRAEAQARVVAAGRAGPPIGRQE